MYNQSFSSSILLKLLRKTDFYDDNRLYDKSHRESVAALAEKSAHSGFQGVNPFKFFHLNGKRHYKVDGLHNNLVLRKIDKNLKKSLGKRTFSRDFIVSTTAKILAENVPYRVYRLDIKSFFESIDRNFLKEQINNLDVTYLTKMNIFYILDYYEKINGAGIPRGVGVSSTLAEIVLSKFDAKISEHDHVYYYIRYVDDIFIVTSGSEDKEKFLQSIESHLPLGLALNKKQDKLSISDVLQPPAWSDNGDKLLYSISYLGYAIKIYNQKKITTQKKPTRKIILDIAESKVNKIKTRIARSFITYVRDGNYQNLKDRLRLLTGNYSIYDINSGRKKFAGIYYNYPLISQNSESIARLDAFREGVIFSKNGRLPSIFYPLVSSGQRSDLVQFSFKIGFDQKKFVHFNSTRVQELQNCWSM